MLPRGGPVLRHGAASRMGRCGGTGPPRSGSAPPSFDAGVGRRRHHRRPLTSSRRPRSPEALRFARGIGVGTRPRPAIVNGARTIHLEFDGEPAIVRLAVGPPVQTTSPPDAAATAPRRLWRRRLLGGIDIEAVTASRHGDRPRLAEAATPMSDPSRRYAAALQSGEFPARTSFPQRSSGFTGSSSNGLASRREETPSRSTSTPKPHDCPTQPGRFADEGRATAIRQAVGGAMIDMNDPSRDRRWMPVRFGSILAPALPRRAIRGDTIQGGRRIAWDRTFCAPATPHRHRPRRRTSPPIARHAPPPTRARGAAALRSAGPGR